MVGAFAEVTDDGSTCTGYRSLSLDIDVFLNNSMTCDPVLHVWLSLTACNRSSAVIEENVQH